MCFVKINSNGESLDTGVVVDLIELSAPTPMEYTNSVKFYFIIYIVNLRFDIL